MNEPTLEYLMRRIEAHKARPEYGRDYRRSGRGVVDFEGSMDFDNESYGKFHDGPTEHGHETEYHEHYEPRHSTHHRTPRLSKTDIHRWKHTMENEDGTHGAHYEMQHIIPAAEKAGVHFEDYSEKEFCLAVNMMYSDYCKVARKYVAPEKELMFFVEMAHAFLEDEDGPEPFEKLALYYHCIVDA